MVKKGETKKTESVEKSYNGGLIVGFLMGIIITLIILIGMFAAGMIKFNNNSQEKLESNVINETEEEEEDNSFVVTFKEEKKEFKNSKDEIVITNKRNVPVITNTSNQVAAYNIEKSLTNISDDDWKSLNMNDYTKDDMLETLPKGIGISYEFSKKAEEDNYITFEYMMSGSMGGVSWPGLWGYTFNTVNGELLSHDDIFIDNGADSVIYDYIINEIGNNSNYKDDLWNGDSGNKDWKTVVKELMFEKGHYYLTDQGMKFTFDKYSLGVGALGVPEVEIPFEKINNYLRDEYKK